jgi:23S rRNA (adenine2030-N6)-methyltransferase
VLVEVALNYRHAFHAGNHADIFKHAALSLILERLKKKPQPFAVLDTHAGVGLYDLASEPARRGSEFGGGVGKILGRPIAAAPAYAALLAELNPAGLAAYPGSPEIARRLLREQDRLILCELHPDDHRELKQRYRRDPRIAVHHRDGYEAIGALVPPPERRGLAFIDPPYEAPGEADRLARALQTGLRKWPTGIFCAWYPIKDPEVRRTLTDAVTAAALPKALRAEFSPFPRTPGAMTGGALILCNTPWRLDEQLAALCRELTPLLGDSGDWSVDWLTGP